MRLPVIALAGCLAAAPVLATPVDYILQADRSTVAFETDYQGGIRITGRMPVASAEVTLDFDRVANSHVDVSVSAADATTSHPLATQAMTGRSVLNARAHPYITFRSTSVERAGDGARISGELTIRGVTRPVTLDARVYRQKGTEAGDRNNLSILLTGAVSRSAFGASGFPNLVSDEVRLKILARITRGN